MTLHLVFSAQSAWAKEGTGTAPSARKQATKKGTAAKRKVHVSAKTLHPSLRLPASHARNRNPGTIKNAVARHSRGATAHSSSGARRPHARPALHPTATAGLPELEDSLDLRSHSALVWDPATSETLFEKNSSSVQPIASISKLMTALVVVEAHQDMSEVIEVTADDIDRIKHTSSRLRIGSQLTRADMLHIALMSSENRAASALGRNYPGGLTAFVAAMNAKAKALGMNDTHYVEPTGLSSENVSSARDLAKLVVAAQAHPIIREYSTNREYEVDPGGPSLQYRNSNHLIANPGWNIILQKTGYISEAGRCLVMQTMIKGRSIVMVFLDAKGKFARAADAGRVRQWLEAAKAPEM
ncbi:MAG TPA: D-alanyl-D-alanine endopeptidase [Noviherbaspirillum sp.]|nr:D-alanyl-D-alanine endopeptidase [Noviherbaspirillum sp.]HJV79919.1 D-alanyl-D-alanine endopeptidase [Noviherbaspirillum sp.]